jgi:hypothetical protein
MPDRASVRVTASSADELARSHDYRCVPRREAAALAA